MTEGETHLVKFSRCSWLEKNSGTWKAASSFWQKGTDLKLNTHHGGGGTLNVLPLLGAGVGPVCSRS